MLSDLQLDTGTLLAFFGVLFVLFVIAISLWYRKYQFKTLFGCYDCGWRGNRERLDAFAEREELPRIMGLLSHLSHVTHLVAIASKEASTRYTCPHCRGRNIERITYKSRQLPPPPPVHSNAKAKEFLRSAGRSAKK